MKRFIAHLIKFKVTYIVTFVVSAAIGLSVFMAFYFTGEKSLTSSLNGTGVAGIVLFGIAFLCLFARWGAFDTFSYGFKQMFTSFFNKEANKYNDMVEYKNELNAKRATASKYYLMMLFVGLMFFIAFGALEIYKATL